MIRHLPQVALIVVTTVFLSSSTLGQEHRTYALFGLDSPDNGPFPSDRHTVPDRAQNTRRRVSLPPPSATCAVSISECEDLAVINELDGFNLQPRLSVPFSGPIEPSTVTSDTVFLVSLGSTVPGQDSMPWGTKVGIDQVVWDTFTNTLHVESDELLAQHTRFALIVTREIRDQNGFPVKASDEFPGGSGGTPRATFLVPGYHHCSTFQGSGRSMASPFPHRSSTRTCRSGITSPSRLDSRISRPWTLSRRTSRTAPSR